ncbi:MAG: hypothetical protein ISS01_02225, partial [Nanoarchaeota archaeon]|nr:hypothetical protein [Nanoarchaeota archaeon]
KELVNIVEKANKKIKDNLTEESVQEVQTLLAQIKEKKILISSFRTTIEKLDNQKQILLKNLFRSGANATELMKKQKDLVERLNSLVNAAKLAKEKMKKAKSAA